MDRQLSPQFIRKRRRQLFLRITVIAFSSVMLIYTLAYLLKPGIQEKEIHTAIVERGTLEISIYSTGKIVPLAEEIITSPVSSKVLEVYKKAGDQVKEGETILQLDLEAFNTEFETKKEELDLKFSKMEQQKNATISQLDEMKMQIQINEMQLKRMAVLLYNEKYLDSIGASTKDKVKQEELNYQVEQLRFEQLKQKYKNQLKAAEVEIHALELDHKIASKNLNLMKKTKGEAQVRSPRTATLTWVEDQIGTSVSQNAQLAIISDLSHYKIEAEIADSYADKISSGNQASVKIGKEKLRGIVGNVSPSVKNGTIKFTVSLTNSHYDKLRPGLKVDVNVIHALRDDAMRLSNGSYYMGPGEYDLWVIRGDKASKCKVILGESSFEQVEVLEGLHTGDKVIISDMGKYQNKNQLQIK